MQTLTHLIDFFIPEHYTLSVTLERVKRTFHGTVTIEGTSPKDDTPILLHAKDLTITTALIDGAAASHIVEGDELRVSLPELIAGKHIVTIQYSGVITDSMHGLYPSYYEHNGEKKELLATQFESHHAREVFPCIDEPAAKATFDLTLTTETGVVALSNMPIYQQRHESDRLVTSFETSPRMSTYLLAWVVGELHKKSSQTKSGVEVSVWATPAQPAESLDFAVDIAVRSIDFLTNTLTLLTHFRNRITSRSPTFHLAQWKTGAWSPIVKLRYWPIQKMLRWKINNQPQQLLLMS